jgi:hypothetical protein
MAVNTQQLVAATSATTAIANLLMVSPQNTVGYQPNLGSATTAPDGTVQLPSQPNPILFHYEGEQAVVSEADITDHYVEDNTEIQDQIALKTPVITTHGFIGELNNVPPAALAILQAAAQKLTAIGAYAPQLSATALLAYSEAFFLYQTASNAANALVSTWSSLANAVTGNSAQAVVGSNGITAGTNQNLQQTYFQQFYYYQQQRTLFTVQTPWAVFQNMAIWKLRPIQDEKTDVITDFDVTFNMIRTASTASSASALGNSTQVSYGGQLNSQASPVTNQGTTTPTSDISLGTGAQSMGVTGITA